MTDFEEVDANPTASSLGPIDLPVPTPFMCHIRAYDIPEVLGQRYQRPGLPQLAELTQNHGIVNTRGDVLILLSVLGSGGAFGTI